MLRCHSKPFAAQDRLVGGLNVDALLTASCPAVAVANGQIFQVVLVLFFCPILKYICELVLSVHSSRVFSDPWQCTLA